MAIKNPAKVRIRLRDRDGDNCFLCGKVIDFSLPRNSSWPMSVTIEHVIPRAAGGSHHIDNLRLAHDVCNRMKGGVYNGTDYAAEHGTTPPRLLEPCSQDADSRARELAGEAFWSRYLAMVDEDSKRQAKWERRRAALAAEGRKIMAVCESAGS